MVPRTISCPLLLQEKEKKKEKKIQGKKGDIESRDNL